MSEQPGYTLELLEPQLLHSSFSGTIDAATLDAFLTKMATMVHVDAFVSIADVSALDTFSKDGRAMAKSVPARIPAMRGMVVYGGGFAQRVVSKLLMTAIRIASDVDILFETAASRDEALILGRTMLTQINEGQVDAHV